MMLFQAISMSLVLHDSENRIIVKLDNLSDESIKEFKENVCDSDAIKFEQGCGPIKTEVNVNAGDNIFLFWW